MKNLITMWQINWKAARTGLVMLCLFQGLGFQARIVLADGKADSTSTKKERTDYVVGPGDILSIAVTDAPEFSGKYRVSQSGLLELPGLPSAIVADGKTPSQLSKEMAQALIDAKLYREPVVNIYVDEYHSRTVTVVGAVTKPSVYPLEKRTTVLEVISQAGGLLPAAGNKLTIVSANAESGSDGTAAKSTKTLDLAKLVKGEEGISNVEVHDGDVISVSTAEVVYVVGAVQKPGGFVTPDQSSGITAMQAIAMAEGMTNIAAQSRAVIIRRSASGSLRENIPINLKGLMSGKTSDVKLEANDILFVPVSGGRQTVHAMGQAAMAAVNGIAIYGAGYRVAGIN